MKKNLLYYFKELVIFIIIVVVFANLISLYKSADLSKKPLDLYELTLVDGAPYTIPTDKPILIHIWATWCPTCKVEASNIQTLSEHYNVLTIAVKSGSDNELITWLKENNYKFKTINDSNGVLASQFNISVFPTTIIYDENRNLVFSDVGYTSTWGLFLRMWYVSTF